MKFTWFNLMPWPYLPDDFRAAHRSVWVDIPNTLYDPEKGHFLYHRYMDQLEYAEAHELIMRAWQSTEPFAFDGKYTQLRYVNLWPRPIQQPHPPVSPAARRRCATGCAT